jgi:hypothetical protein
MTTRSPLRCLGGELAPAELGGDLFAFSQLPEPARAALWSVLAPSLPAPLPDEAEQALDAFCSKYSVDSEHLGRVVRAARFVVRAAALRGLDEAELAADLATLTPDPEAVTTLVGGYPRARKLLGATALKRAMDAFGESLVDVEFRVDRVVGASEAPRLDAPVAFLSLGLRSRDGARSLKLQADLEGVRRLRAACEAIERICSRS